MYSRVKYILCIYSCMLGIQVYENRRTKLSSPGHAIKNIFKFFFNGLTSGLHVHVSFTSMCTANSALTDVSHRSGLLSKQD
jgi:hypothetical protein